eukprot:4088180-Amphidinium_carterae.1
MSMHGSWGKCNLAEILSRASDCVGMLGRQPIPAQFEHWALAWKSQTDDTMRNSMPDVLAEKNEQDELRKRWPQTPVGVPTRCLVGAEVGLEAKYTERRASLSTQLESFRQQKDTTQEELEDMRGQPALFMSCVTPLKCRALPQLHHLCV